MMKQTTQNSFSKDCSEDQANSNIESNNQGPFQSCNCSNYPLKNDEPTQSSIQEVEQKQVQTNNNTSFHSKKTISNSEYYRQCIIWLIQNKRRFKIKQQTEYIAISSMIRYANLIKQLKYKAEIISAVCLLLAIKFNQIYTPSIKSILTTFNFAVTRIQLVRIQAHILQLFEFQMYINNNPYSVVMTLLKNQTLQKKTNAIKLLFLSMVHQKILEFDQQYIGYSIVYLIKPELIPTNISLDMIKVKKMAFTIYQFYRQKKQPKKDTSFK